MDGDQGVRGEPGVVLVPRTFLADAALWIAAFLAGAGVYGVLRAPGKDQPWAYAGVSVALVVGLALPLLWAGRRLRLQRIEVLPDRVRLRVGDRIVREVVLDELARVEAADHVSQSSLNGPRRLPSVTLRSEHTGIVASRHQVETLTPLLVVLAPHVRRRPELVPEGQRETFRGYLADAGLLAPPL